MMLNKNIINSHKNDYFEKDYCLFSNLFQILLKILSYDQISTEKII